MDIEKEEVTNPKGRTIPLECCGSGEHTGCGNCTQYKANELQCYDCDCVSKLGFAAIILALLGIFIGIDENTINSLFAAGVVLSLIG